MNILLTVILGLLLTIGIYGAKTVSPPAKGLFVTAPDYSCTNCCDIDTNRRIL